MPKSKKRSEKKNENLAGISYVISVVIVLILHYFAISNLYINETGQILIDFIILFILMGLSGNILKIKFREKKKDFDGIVAFLTAVGTLVLNYYVISSIKADSVWKLLIDLAVFTFACAGIIFVVDKTVGN